MLTYYCYSNIGIMLPVCNEHNIITVDYTQCFGDWTQFT